MPMQTLSDILRDGFCQKGKTFRSGELPRLYRQGYEDWEEYVLFIFDDNFPESEPTEVEGRGRTEAEALAWFHKHWYLDECDYTIFRKQVTFTKLETNMQVTE